MIPKKLDRVGAADLQALVDTGAPESRVLEFKRELQVSTRDQRVDFLADVSSFANAVGGDLIYGIDAPNGAALDLPGILLPDPDGTVRLLDQLIQNGLQPRLPGVGIRPLPLGEDRHAIIVRVQQSWVAPHRVTLDGHDKFYARISAGRRALDVGELRTAFLQSETLTQRIRSFRADRLAALLAGETPVQFSAGPFMVLHVLPLTAFSTSTRFDVSKYPDGLRDVILLGEQSSTHRINLDGIVRHTPGKGPSLAYAQIYRTGMIESTQAFEVGHYSEGKPVIPSQSYEQDLLTAIPAYVRVLERIGAGFPMFVFLTFLRIRECVFALRSGYRNIEEARPDALVLPEAVIEGPGFNLADTLRPLFDMVWNAFGLPRSANFDAEGRWASGP
jgi:hypothetical protein